MRSFIAGVCLLSFAANADATYITSGQIITDDSTGIEWLQLTATKGLTYADALTTYQSDGWRYATNEEIVNMFNDFFPEFIPNSVDGTSRYSSSYSSYTYTCGFGGTCYGTSSFVTPDSDYTRSQQDADILDWISVFYATSRYYSYGSSGYSTIGLYRDEFGVLREMGAGHSGYSYYDRWGSSSYVLGPDYTFAPDDSSFGNIGTFLVRTNTVPEPASLALIGFGLAGLGITRRRRAAEMAR